MHSLPASSRTLRAARPLLGVMSRRAAIVGIPRSLGNSRPRGAAADLLPYLPNIP
jgi:hypothetical protein